MTTRDFTANVISASKVVPDGNFKDSKASGVWDINEALDLIKGGNWPNVANLNPAAFADGLFQCHLYDGTGSQQTITNNIDFTKGGLIITKRRDSTTGNGPYWNDTERGVNNYVRSDSDGGNGAQNTSSTGAVVSTSSTGYVVGTFNGWNNSSGEYVSWSFRKQPKFFDIVTYSGTGSVQNISHNLGSVPGMILIKDYSASNAWAVYHRGVDSSAPEDYALNLAATSARDDATAYFNDTAPTSSVFTVGTTARTNNNGSTYVAYLFAHNNNDGGFGEPEDQDIIKCGSVTADGSGNFTESLGFEPQFILFKATNQAEGWEIFDGMRNLTAVRFYNTGIEANSNAAEGTGSKNLQINADGFASTGGVSANITYIYMAIRRGGMQTPTAASSVFHVATYSSNGNSNIFNTGFDVDMNINTRQASTQKYNLVRLLGDGYLKINTTGAQTNDLDYKFFDNRSNVLDIKTSFWSNETDTVSWSWKRARGYFDVVPYTGTGSVRTVTHNLGVVPEMFWVKTLDSTESWAVFHKNIGNSYQTVLNLANARLSDSTSYNNTDPTSSVFTVGTNDQLNKSGDDYIAFLFATVSGVSKVGSFTQSGATNVDCGFTGDTPSFILFKRIDSAGSWYVFDSARGIIAGNDPYFYFNTTAAETTNEDIVDPYSGGFATTSTLTNGDYVFYAIAAIS